MNASIALRSTVILGAVALIWGGCSFWASRRERAAKEALAAEIRAEIAARAPTPDRAAGRVDLTPEYDAILAPLLAGSPSDDRAILEALQEEKAWSGMPKVVKSALAAHAASLALLDTLVADRPGGHMAMGRDWNRWHRLRNLVVARGRSQMIRCDWDGFLATVRALRRASEDFLASRAPEAEFLPAFYAMHWSLEGQRLLALAARDPGLPEGAAIEALALASRPWSVEGAWARVDAGFLEDGDRLCLDLLGDDSDAVLRKYGFVEETSFLDRAGRIFEDGRRRADAVDGPPSVETLRAMRALAERYRRALAAKDAMAIAVDGELERESSRDLGCGWTGNHLRAYPAAGRNRWREDTRIPVLRAAFAIRIHEARTGSPPATLAELVPSILDAVPVDPWTKTPVSYGRKPGGGWFVEAGPPAREFEHEGGVIEKSEPYRIER